MKQLFNCRIKKFKKLERLGAVQSLMLRDRTASTFIGIPLSAHSSIADMPLPFAVPLLIGYGISLSMIK